MTYHSLAALAWFLFAPVPRPNSKTGTAGISAGTVAIMIRWRGTAGSFRSAGYFIDASVGEPFAAFDHRADVEQDGADFRLNVSPYVTPQAQLAYEWLPEPSTGTPLESHKPTDSMQVLLRRAAREGGRFEHALQVARRALAATAGAPAHTWYPRSPAATRHSTC